MLIGDPDSSDRDDDTEGLEEGKVVRQNHDMIGT